MHSNFRCYDARRNVLTKFYELDTIVMNRDDEGSRKKVESPSSVFSPRRTRSDGYSCFRQLQRCGESQEDVR